MKERIEKMKNTKKKGFTLVELLVVIAIMAILALIAVPNFSGYIGKSRDARIQSDLKTVYSAAKVSIEDSDGIKLDDAVEKSEIFNESIKSLVNFSSDESEEQYYGRYEFLDKEGNLVIKYTDINDKKHYYPKEFDNSSGGNNGDEYLADDKDFKWEEQWDGYTATNETGTGYYKYIGEAEIVKIPHEINGHPMKSYYGMFMETSVEKVISDNSNITNMYNMFYLSQATTLDLSNFDTSSVTNMWGMFGYSKATLITFGDGFNTSNVEDMGRMFSGSKATSLDLSSFNTSNVTDMFAMFQGSQATTLNLSSFNTSNVTDMSEMFYASQATSITGLSSFDTSNVTSMSAMFYQSQATSLDLSSFNTSKVTNMSRMFRESQVTTLDLSSFDTSKVNPSYGWNNMFNGSNATTGYARTQEDANKFNASSNKPSELNFIVK